MSPPAPRTIGSHADGDALIQLLAPGGDRQDHPAYPLELTPAQCRGLYRDMAVIRRFDAEGERLQRLGELALWVPCRGQEAAQAGSARALAANDYVFPSYREHGVAWCRGIELIDVLAMWRGVSHGGWDPAARNFHLFTIVVGAQALHAVGYAMGVQRDRTGEAVVVYFGDGAMSQGDVAEAFNFAAVCNAPVLFFCQNNQWAISEPNARQTRVPLFRRAAGYGFPGIRVDGNDVLACLAVTRKALNHVRGGHGPVLIEAFTYRMGPHTTADDPGRYRDETDVADWELRDPLTRYRTFLEKNELAGGSFFESVDREAGEIAQRAHDDCRALPDPPPHSIFDHVYAMRHPVLAAERAQHPACLEIPR